MRYRHLRPFEGYHNLCVRPPNRAAWAADSINHETEFFRNAKSAWNFKGGAGSIKFSDRALDRLVIHYNNGDFQN